MVHWTNLSSRSVGSGLLDLPRLTSRTHTCRTKVQDLSAPARYMVVLFPVFVTCTITSCLSVAKQLLERSFSMIMISVLSFILFVVPVSTGVFLQQQRDEDNYFTSPKGTSDDNDNSRNEVWELGTYHKVSWKTTFTNFSISLFRMKPNTDDPRKPLWDRYGWLNRNTNLTMKTLPFSQFNSL